ncbi:hypothetical protein Taro_032406 [Colocasia esculenta]|uniref:Uncharacterized protein n=1 Tax=Colocasia esculenta TaxID=4460 RepID=A0A843W9C6_COLES|nr:hypothetical protein [Colocasia esculenta]
MAHPPVCRPVVDGRDRHLMFICLARGGRGGRRRRAPFECSTFFSFRLPEKQKNDRAQGFTSRFVFCMLGLAMLAGTTQAVSRTDQTEVQALLAIHDRWRLDPPWSGDDPCPKVAADPYANNTFDKGEVAILCDCTYAENTTCHVMGLYAPALLPYI